MKELLRMLPRVDELMARPEFDGIKRPILKQQISKLLDAIRREIQEGLIVDSIELFSRLEEELRKLSILLQEGTLKRVINGTGVLLHTNMGRAIVRTKGLEDFVSHYSNLEFNLETGERGSRDIHISTPLNLLLGSQDAIAVNNNASAVLLVLSEFAKGRKFVASRGEQAEIGGSFRIPEVALMSGAEMIEIGTTNVTRLSDYERALAMCEDLSMVLRVEPSNFSVIGQSNRPSNEAIHNWCRQNRIPYYVDLGSGVLDPNHLKHYVDEDSVSAKTIASVLEHADLLSFSGDKLFGSFQAGIIVGNKPFIQRLKRNPLYRALRLDKSTIYALSRTIMSLIHEDGSQYSDQLFDSMLNMSPEVIERRVDHFIQSVESRSSKFKLYKTIMNASIGGGTFAVSSIPSYGIVISHSDFTSSELVRWLRCQSTPVIAASKQDQVMLDFRTIGDDDEELLFKLFIE